MSSARAETTVERTQSRHNCTISGTPPGVESIFGLHRGLVAWNEGTGASSDPLGTPAAPGEATWTARVAALAPVMLFLAFALERADNSGLNDYPQ